ncbi:MAG: periplasmic heavy metal sensor [Candidatus Omnitrophica bacterium]|nr:periplasmic heavy metal sensor [Candidatus Omnitrophota bacterium]
MKRLLIGSVLFGLIAAVVYLATLGCCQLVGVRPRPVSMTRQLRLTPGERQAVAALEKDFLAQKQISCQALCAKRAQMIQLLRQPEPDQGTLAVLTQEIAQEQAVLERTTLEHLLAVGRQLDPSQRERLTALMTDELRSACRMTACGATAGCAAGGRSGFASSSESHAVVKKR